MDNPKRKKVHHVGIFIGIYNGVPYMVDNGSNGVQIRPVNAVISDSRGEYYVTAFFNPE